MKKLSFLMLFLCGISNVANAQVRIGTLDPPHSAAVLDLSVIKSNDTDVELGLLLPHVALKSVDEFQLECEECNLSAATGMLVYNTSKATEGAKGLTGQFVWNGAKWLPVGGLDSQMSIETNKDGNNKMYGIETPVPADGSITIEATIINVGCEEADGEYHFMLVSGDAILEPASSVSPNFSLTFYQNEQHRDRWAIVQVTDPCGKSALFQLVQDKAACGAITYNVTSVAYQGKQNICTGGATYVWVDGVDIEGGETDTKVESTNLGSIDYTWIYLNTIVGTGQGIAITSPGTYRVYAGIPGCGDFKEVLVGRDESGQAQPIHKLVYTNEGQICGTEPVILQVLNVLKTTIGETLPVVQYLEQVHWFRNGVEVVFTGSLDGISIETGTTDNPIAIKVSGSQWIGEWYACVTKTALLEDGVSNPDHCASQPTEKVFITYNSGGSGQNTPIQATINDVPWTASDYSTNYVICANSTVRLEITNYEQYPSSRRFYWYFNGELWGESSGEAIYVIPRDAATGVISVKLITDSEHCPLTLTTKELTVNTENEPLQPSIQWHGAANGVGYICQDAPASCYVASSQNGITYQWFKNGSTTPCFVNLKSDEDTHPDGTTDEINGTTYQYTADETMRRIYEIAEPGTYTVRYQSEGGCWSRISDPIVISRSAAASLQWYVGPTLQEYSVINGMSETWSVRVSPQADKLTWKAYYDAGSGSFVDASEYISIRTIGDGTTALISFNFPQEIVYPSHTATVYVAVTAENSCGQTTLGDDWQFTVRDGCSPITTMALNIVPSSGIVLAQTLSCSVTANGSQDHYYQAWLYLDNASTTLIPNADNGIYYDKTWKEVARAAYDNGGTPIEINLDASHKCKVYPETGIADFDDDRYVKLLMLDWTRGTDLNPDNTLVLKTFALGDHYVMVNASNGCTDKSTPAHLANFVKIHVDMNPSLVTAGQAPDIDYSLFAGQKTCFDVWQTEDTGTNSWAGERLPFNVRPNDFPISSQVDGKYSFEYQWVIGGIDAAVTKAQQTVMFALSGNTEIVNSVTKNGNNPVVNFNSNVIDKAKEKTRNNRLVVTLNAYYQGTDHQYYMIKTDIAVQDAACGCPAKVGSSTWRMFDCHNCGADRTKNPMTSSSADLRGEYYIWGYGNFPFVDRNKKQHTNTTEYLNYDVDRKAKFSGWYNVYPYKGSSDPFLKGKNWDAAPQYSPCPVGWRVATGDVWYNSVWANNSVSLANGFVNIGKYIRLPKEGYYHSSSSEVGKDGSYLANYSSPSGYRYDYWTATELDSDEARNFYSIAENSPTWGRIPKFYSEPVRCIQEGTSYSGSSSDNNP